VAPGSRRFLAAALAAAAAVTTLLGLSGPVAAAPVAAEAPALQAFGACLSARKAGDVLVLIDESGSLKRTDPDAARVSAARFLLERFAALADAQELDLAVATAGFSADFRASQGWTTLDGSSVGGVSDSLEDFAARDDGLDTDYWNALDGSRRLLADRARERSGSTPAGTCQAVVWLSDGALDIETRDGSAGRDDVKAYAEDVDLSTDAGAAAAEAAARESLCREGGLVDQVRGSDVYTFAVGLEAPADPPDFALFESIATGTSAAGACGAPVTEPVGDFYRASTLEDLLLAFNKIAANGGVLEQSTPVCGGEAAEVCAHSFVLDDSIGSVRLLASTGAPGIQLSLSPPGEAPTLLPYTPDQQPTPVDVSGLPVEVTWETEQTAAVEFARVDGLPWTGQWSLYFIDPDGTNADVTARSQLQIAGDLAPAWPGAGTAELETGAVLTGVQLGLARLSTGEPVDPEALRGSATLSAELVRPDGATVTISDGLDATEPIPTLDLDLTDVPPGRAVVRLTLSVTTAEVPAAAGRPSIPGTALVDQVVDLPVEVAVPPEYPSVPDLLDLGDQGETTTLTGSLPITGQGCVWVRQLAVGTIPEGSGTAEPTTSASTPESCVKVIEGTPGELPIEVRLGAPGTGTVQGTMTVVLQPVGEGEVIEKEVKFTGDVVKPLDVGRTLWVFVVALLVGLGLPLLVAQLARWFAARVPGVAFAVQVVPVEVTSDGVLRDGSSFRLDHRSGEVVTLPLKGTRHLVLPGAGATLRTRTGFDLRRVAAVEVSSPGAATLAPPALRRTRRGFEAQLPLDVQNRWFAVAGPAGIRVVAMPTTGADQVAVNRIAADVNHRLPRLVEAWRAETGEAAPPSAWAQAPAGAAGAGQAGGNDWFGSTPTAGAPGPTPGASRPGDAGTDGKGRSEPPPPSDESWWNG
jgi:hypothetical protein